MSWLDNIDILGLFILLLIVPTIPCILLWWFILPATIWQIIAMIFLSIVIYIIFAIIEMIVVFILTD